MDDDAKHHQAELNANEFLRERFPVLVTDKDLLSISASRFFQERPEASLLPGLVSGL